MSGTAPLSNRDSRTLTLPAVAALCSGVSPELSDVFTDTISLLYMSNESANPVGFVAAMCSGVIPLQFAQFALAPAHMRSRMNRRPALLWGGLAPGLAARWRGVSPLESTASGNAPCLRRSLQISGVQRNVLAAKCRGVLPAESRLFGDTELLSRSSAT